MKTISFAKTTSFTKVADFVKAPSIISLFDFVSICLLVTIFSALFPDLASAQTTTGSNTGVTTTTADDNVLVSTMCNVLRIVTGSAGKAFAAFAIISVGIGFFTGKVSWGLLIGVAVGVALIFGAPTVVAAITGKGLYNCNGAV